MSLKDIALLTNIDDEAILSDDEGSTVIMIELAKMGAILMMPGDTLKVELSGLVVGNNYAVNAIEDTVVGGSPLLKFETKTMKRDDTDVDFFLNGYTHLLIDDIPEVEQYQLTGANGNVAKFEPEELRAIVRQMDVLQIVQPDGTAYVEPAKISLPISPGGFTIYNRINIRKAQSGIVNLTLRREV
ncbi:hypothetical protein KJK34_04685 [Flavobacterium sp. D11R37]|uniref:hypothetical protein n=1 Tax=Flavobacterium coralii TaxID=2838017 RepID=UPI001CA6CCEA|nr:hypothetical protein [Flavobacterium coralii]MBY8962043.1 hypothetical protein [Flavobacterium coralii]